MTDEARIVQLTEHMRFERKPAIASREKAAYAALEAACGDAMRSLNKLHLRLWHASEGDYRSLPLSEARILLEETREKIDAALDKCPRSSEKA